jgi:LacI family transcriptional regulator
VPTIKDVARQARVSVATVSRVLNESGYFDEDTARAVRRAVEELGYRPNVHWTRLKRRSSKTIAFLLGNRDSMNSMQMSVLMACEKSLHEAGYDLVFSSFRYQENERSAQIKLPQILSHEGLIDGAILAGKHYRNLLQVFSRLKLPYALLSSNFSGQPSDIERNAISYDDVAGAYEATSYLTRLGHRSIAFVGLSRMPWFHRRYEGYRRAMRQAGLTEYALTEDWQISGVEYGELATEQLLREPHLPTAIFAANDEAAAGAWKALVKRHVQIPREISLVGFGDRREFSILEPSLTTVSSFPEKLGTSLAKMLLERLGNGGLAVPSEVYPCKLIERSSCAPPMSRVELVAKV